MAGEITCSECGHRNQLGSNFCSSCGAPVAPEGSDHPTVTFQVPSPAEPVGDDVVADARDLPADLGMLVVTRGQNAGSRFTISQPVTTAGRHPESDIFLDDVTVSRRHVEIETGPNGFTVRDVGSLNGTYLNRERIEESPLTSGDELQIGKFKLVFLLGGSGG